MMTAGAHVDEYKKKHTARLSVSLFQAKADLAIDTLIVRLRMHPDKHLLQQKVEREILH